MEVRFLNYTCPSPTHQKSELFGKYLSLQQTDMYNLKIIY